MIALACIAMLFSCGDSGSEDGTVGGEECSHIWSTPTCKELSKCTLCGIEQGEIGGHKLVKSGTVAPTCTEWGYTNYICAGCGLTVRGDVTNALGHTFGDWVTDNTTKLCDEARLSVRECSTCGFEEADYIASAAHTLISHEAKSPTCTEPGYNAYETCEKCPYTTYEEIPASHSYTSTTLPPTCTESGYTTHTCSGCGDSYNDALENPTGHTMGAWYQESDATTTADGEMRSSCLNCAHYETKGLTVLTSGNFGFGTPPTSAATYTLYENGTLKISGTGATFNCGWNGANQPFIDYRDRITKIVIGEGITGNSGGDFANLPNLTTVEFATTFTKINTNAFMDSFKSDISTITIPKSVTYVGCYIIGPFSANNAVFTDIIFENPDTVFYTNPSNTANELKIFNKGLYNSSITLYSYGASNNVSAYAAKIGASYVDLNARIYGTVDNLTYDFFDGTLTLSASNPASTATLPAEAPWGALLDKSRVTRLVVEAGITDIPANYFADYTALTEITLADTVNSIGDQAFSTSTACTIALSVKLPEGIATLGKSIFKNRSAVTVTAFSGSAADTYTEDGVKVNIVKVFRLLLIGNSLSLDAADNSGGGTTSMLYDIVKSMLGENSYVEIATLYSGARTAAWHATMARDSVDAYQFSIVSDDTKGKWSVISNACTSEYGLKYRNWDAVTVQPYGNETQTGVDDTTTGITGSYKDESFLSLSASLPYLLDHIAKHSADSDIYYYLTWSSSTSAYLNTNASKYTTMIDVAVKAAANKGQEGSFSGIIPVGTAIQNARSTYFALLNYTDSDSLDPQKNLQRDNVHLSRSIGRYIAALTFAEILIPESLREADYDLPEMKDSAVIGELPVGYSELARLAVAEAVATAKAGTYKPTELKGYTTDPAASTATAIGKLSFSGITATDTGALIAEIIAKASATAPEGALITVELNSSVNITAAPTDFSATVTVTYGYTSAEVQISGTVSK